MNPAAPPPGRLVVAGHIVPCLNICLEMNTDHEGRYRGWHVRTKILHDIVTQCIDQYGTFYSWDHSRGFYVYRGEVRIAGFSDIAGEDAQDVLLTGEGDLNGEGLFHD